MIDIDLVARFGVALVAVLALIVGLAWVARRYGPGAGMGFSPGKERRLAIVEATSLDAKSRLVLVRRDRVEHLVLLGPAGATVIERGINNAATIAVGSEPVTS
jgi:flagellar protein FliO/FliZ